MLIPNKYNGDSVDGRRIYYFGSGGGQPTYTESKVTNSNIPEYAQPYVENMLGAAQKQVYGADGTSFQPYKAFEALCVSDIAVPNWPGNCKF